MEPYRTDEYLGEIGDIVDLDGEKYTIVDYAVDISDYREQELMKNEDVFI